jgi:hypothetical protein
LLSVIPVGNRARTLICTRNPSLLVVAVREIGRDFGVEVVKVSVVSVEIVVERVERVDRVLGSGASGSSSSSSGTSVQVGESKIGASGRRGWRGRGAIAFGRARFAFRSMRRASRVRAFRWAGPNRASVASRAAFPCWKARRLAARALAWAASWARLVSHPFRAAAARRRVSA